MFAANSRASSAKLRSSHICKVRSKSSGHLSWLLIKSFGCGVGTAILLFALAAQIFAHTALSLELVKPATCASVAVGAVLSGLVLANGIAQKRLLCGVSVGVFYALCLSLTTALSGKPLVFDHVNLALLAALLFGGTAGGVLSALGAVGEHCARTLMRARDQHRPPYTPKRALDSGSSAGAAAALGIQKLAGKNDLFAFSSVFLTGYLAGIPLGRFELHGAFTSLTEHVMAAQSYTAFWSVWCSWFAAAFLQASLIYLCGFHLWGSIFMGAYFAFKGTVLGVCASAIYASGGARALVVYWLLNCLPELVLSAFMLWLAHSSCRVSQSLSSIVFSGCRCALNGAIRRLSVHYLLCLLGCAVSSFMFSGSAVLFASVLL